MSRLVKKALHTFSPEKSPMTTEKSVIQLPTLKAPVAPLTGDPVTLAIIGGGERGKTFGDFVLAHSHYCKVIAVAEPRPQTRKMFATTYGVPVKNVFVSHRELLTASDALVEEGKPRIAMAVIICVHDRMHAKFTIEFARRGFHVLCEKPLGIDAKECIKVTEEVEKAGIVFALGHNLPYSPYVSSLTSLIHSGRLGRLLNITHLEPVGYYHFAHSYVRGHWKAEATSAPIVLTKSSHDIDIFCKWLWPLVPSKVSSFAGLGHFRKERKPQGAEDVKRCLECPENIESQCEYSAKTIYLSLVQGGHTGWPVSVIVDGTPTVETITKALEETNYGLCVYESANDVPDNQTISMQFTSPDLTTPSSNDAHLPPTNPTVNFTITAHTSSICMRQTRLHFEHGEVIGDMSTYTISDFRNPRRGAERVVPRYVRGGHGGGDSGLIRAWLKAVREKEGMGWAPADQLGWDDCYPEQEGGEIVPGEREHGPLGYSSSVRDQLRVFLTGFAIEEARRQGIVVDCEEFTNRALEKYRKDRAGDGLNRIDQAARPKVAIELEQA